MPIFRILVTASRKWPEHMADVIEDELDRQVEWAVKNIPGVQIQLVHGNARGGDRMADRWAYRRRAMRWPVLEPERHPAKWHDPCRAECMPGHRRQDKPAPNRPASRDEFTICPMQGFYRNDHMVLLGADVCLSFVYNGSRGARQCERSARLAGIRTVPIERWSGTIPPSTRG